MSFDPLPREFRESQYFLATYELLDGEHEHKGAVIFEAETAAEAYKLAAAEEFALDTDAPTFYFSFAGDGMTIYKNTAYREISHEQMAFLEQVGLAFRKLTERKNVFVVLGARGYVGNSGGVVQALW